MFIARPINIEVTSKGKPTANEPYKENMTNLANQYEYWNSVSNSKTFTHPVDVERFKSIVPKHADILDFGCGYGRTCDELYRLGFPNITGVDTSQMMIGRGHKAYPHLNLRALRNNAVPFHQNTFDTVILFAVLTCIPTNKGQRALISDIYRVLRPGGIVYISDYRLQNNERNLNRYERFKDKYDSYGIFELPEGAVVRHHDQDWISSLLSDFNTVELFDIHVTTMNGNRSLGFQYFGRKPINQ